VLGQAHYRAGNWEESIEALEEALPQADDYFTAYASLLLAMAHAQLGNQEQARTWFAKGAKGAQKVQPGGYGRIGRLHNEASLLLESKETSKSKAN
jgi:tetratricopeptide (TPR) repeat protein